MHLRGKIKWVLALFAAAAVPCFGDLAYVANQGDNTVSVIDTSSNIVVGTITVGHLPSSVAVTPDGQFVYVANANDNTVSVIEASPLGPSQDRVLVTLTVGGNPRALAVAPNGRFVYVGNVADGTVSIIDVATQTVSATTIPLSPGYQAGQTLYSLVVTPDSKLIYTGPSASNGIDVINTGTNAQIDEVVFGAGHITGLAAANTTLGQLVFGSFTTNTLPLATFAEGIDANLSSLTFDQVIVDADTTDAAHAAAEGVAISPNGQVGAQALANGNFVTFSPTTGGLFGDDFLGLNAFVLAFTSDSRFAYVTTTGFTPHHVFAIDVSNPAVPVVVAEITVGTDPLAIAIGPSPFAISSPTNLTGSQKKNDFGLIYELFNALQWQAGTIPAAGFNVYRDGVLIATLGSSTFSYQDHNRKKGAITTYAVTSIASSGTESSPVTISLP